MHKKQNELIGLLMKILPEEAKTVSPANELTLFRVDNSFRRTPFQYNSEIIILAQGTKNVYLGNEIYTYDCSNYLVLPVPIPAECEAVIEPGKPLLGLSVTIDPIKVGEIMLEIDDAPQKTGALPKGIYCAPMNIELFDSAIRLLKAISNEQDKKIMAPMIMREIIYRVLQGEKGEILQSIARSNRRFFQISKVLHKIHESYRTEFDIEKLAKEVDMSSTTFHSNFKAVTDTSPLQYIKNVRLHKARSLMIQQGLNANIAAVEVGYESPSQFSREYKRLFGITPAKDVIVASQ